MADARVSAQQLPRLTHASMKSSICEEDVVISGMACRLPESDNVNEFRDNLMNHVDMMTVDDRRWTPGKYEIPPRMAKVKDISKFDATYFGVHSAQAAKMDPQLRMLLETTHEAIVDAGVNPEDLRGSNTGVFVGNCANDSQMAWTGDPASTSGYTMLGCLSGMLSNRISFTFDFKGPSFTVDTACSSSSVALDQALLAIRSGQCDTAIVAAANLCQLPTISAQFVKLNMLSPDGACKSFDESGNGYARAEAVVSIFLQKKKSSNRIYAQLVHSKINSDGAKDGEVGITYPSGKCQLKLMKELYEECGVNPHDVSYVEAHGTGTKAGDPEEVNAIADMFCEGRPSPLLLGSTKSNMGHPEAASGITAMTKVLIASEEKMLPANLHFKSPNKNIPGLVDGRLKVVTENTEWNGGLVSISSFGFGGTNVHTLLDTSVVDRMAKEKPLGDTRRLLTYCGRTEATLQKLFDEVHKSHSENSSLHALLGKSSCQGYKHQPYRGFTIFNKPRDDVTVDIQKCEGESRELWYIFSGMGSQWFGMAKEMMQLDIFIQSIQRSSSYLSEFNIDLSALLMSDDSSSFINTINSFVSLTSIQVALVDILSALGVTPDGIIGHSVGELGSGYADGSLTAKEAVQSAYWRGKSIADAQLKPGAMAAVGLTWEEAKSRCPEGVVPACHNSVDTVTISGDAQPLREFVQQLKKEDIFAKEVSTNGVAFHSPHMAAVAPVLKESLQKVITPKKRSSKWISTSASEDANADIFHYSSAEYHVNNLLSPVKFKEALDSIPDDAITVEIAPHAILQSILKRSLNADCIIIGLQDKRHLDNLELFYQGVGRMYQAGLNVNVNGLYADISFPVPRGTPSISSLLGWDHSVTHDVPSEHDMQSSTSFGMKVEVNLADKDKYLLGHQLDGRLIYPSAGYFIAVWKTLACAKGQDYTSMPVVFEDVDILAPILTQKDDQFILCVSILPSTGAFEVMHNDSIKASGKVRTVEGGEKTLISLITDMESSGLISDVEMSSKDVYYDLRLKGYEYSGDFQGIVSASPEGENAMLKWNNNWLTFFDSMLQTHLLSIHDYAFRLPLRLSSLKIDPAEHSMRMVAHGEHSYCVPLKRNDDLDMMQCGGIQLVGMELSIAPRIVKQKPAILETYQFTPNERAVAAEDADYLNCCSFAAQKALQSEPNGHGTTVPHDLLKELARLPRSHDIPSPEPYTDTKRYPLLASLRSSTSSNVSDNFWQDSLLTSIHAVKYIKPALDIVCESFQTKKLSITELVDSQAVSCQENLLASMDTVSNITVAYTAWVSPSGRLPQNEGNRVSVTQSEHEVDEQPTTSQHLVLCSWIAEKSGSMATFHEKPTANRFPSTVNRSYNNEQASRTQKKPRRLDAAMKMLKESGFPSTVEYTFNNGNTLVKQKKSKQLDAVLGIQGENGFPATIEDTYNIKNGCMNQEKPRKLEIALKMLRADGYLMTVDYTRDNMEMESCLSHELELLYKVENPLLTLTLWRTKAGLSTDDEVMMIQGFGTDWLEPLKEKLEVMNSTGSEKKLWLVSGERNGAIGLVNSLREETAGDKIRCMFNAGEGELPDFNSPECRRQREKNLAMNVYFNGIWGAYRHTPLECRDKVTTKYADINIYPPGSDMSNIRWIESSLKYAASSTTHELCNISYVSINLNDILLVGGQLQPEALPDHEKLDNCMLGQEFSGYTQKDQRRVMGVCKGRALATVVNADKDYMWDVPDSWSMRDAASVPYVYSTAYYALLVRGNLQPYETLLIHSATGGVATAALRIALNLKCQVIATVDSDEKRQLLRKMFPELRNELIIDSDSTAFEFEIKRLTRGKGVNVVLNSLQDEKLQASIRVLAEHGRFLQIGKAAMTKNSLIGLGSFLKDICFHGVTIDALLQDGNKDWRVVRDLVTKGIKLGVVRPLNSELFRKDEIVQAFRLMSSGKNLARVMVEVNPNRVGALQSVEAMPRFYCHSEKSYLLAGGLGGVGLEVARWLVSRGARKLVLTSRSGITDGYQAKLVSTMRANGVDVRISSKNIVRYAEAEQLIKECMSMGPVGGVFNLAMVLKDAMLENQTEQTFQAVLDPKVKGTFNLDRATRRICSNSLDHFVAFSSIWGGRGNAGQTNYSYANTVMERICEDRHAAGVPGLAIQWGSIGDVGVVMNTMGDNDFVLGGALPQRISSCLKVLETFLCEPSHPVLSSYVMADKTQVVAEDKDVNVDDVISSVFRIIGVTDLSTISKDSTLSSLGLDSFTAAEVKQVLERTFNIYYTMKEIRTLTISTLKSADLSISQ